MLASSPKTLDVPGEPGQTVTIRKLGWKALEAAEQAMRARGIQRLREQGQPAIDRAIADAGGKANLYAQVDAQPWLKYDAAVLIRRSVLSWNPPHVTPPEDDPQWWWLAKEILAFSMPARPKAIACENGAAEAHDTEPGE